MNQKGRITFGAHDVRPTIIPQRIGTALIVVFVKQYSLEPTSDASGMVVNNITMAMVDPLV
jgi:hypothetical protein